MSIPTILYRRVSTDDQENNTSLETQQIACARYAADHGMTIVADIQDVMSGAKLDRPGLTQARELIQAGAATALVVYASDRLTRSLAHSLLLRDEFKAAGVTLHCVTKGASQQTPEGTLFDNIESAFAEYERLKIASRMASGRKRKLEQGQVICGHALPFGYTWHEEPSPDKTKKPLRWVVIDEEAASVVRLIYDWYLHEDLGACKIINRLAELGIASPADRRTYNLKPKTKRSLAQWCTTSILWILRNRAYRGEYEIRHGDEMITVPVPPIIEPSVWDAVAIKREERKRFSRRNAHFIYLLSGRVRCAHCGAACSGLLMNGVRRYYRCLRTYHHTIYSVEPCKARYFRMEPLEDAVWNWLDNEVLNEGHIREAVSGRDDGTASEQERLQRHRDVYARQLDELEMQIGRLASLYTSGLFKMEEIAEQKQLLDASKASTRVELEKTEARLAALETVPDREAELCALVRELRAQIAVGLTRDQKRRIIHLLDCEVKLAIDEDGAQWADVVCYLTLDHERLLVGGVSNVITHNTNRQSGNC